MNRIACLAATVAACLAWAQAGLAAPIHEAAKNGDVAKVRQLIEAGADFRAKNEYQQTPLFVAAQAGQVEAVKLLMRRDAKTKKADQQELDALLRTAVQSGREKLAKWLIEQGANVNAGAAKPAREAPEEKEPSLLMLAASEGRYNEKLMALLIAHGAKAREGEDEDRILIGWAAAEGKTALLKQLLDRGVDANYCLVEESTASCLQPLELAVRNGRLKAAELLLAHGAAMENESALAICRHFLPLLKRVVPHKTGTGGVKSGRDGGYSAELAEAVVCGDKAMLAYLMENSPQVDYEHVTQVLQQLLNPYDPYGQSDGLQRVSPDAALFSTLYAGDPNFTQHASSLAEQALRGGHDAFADLLFARGATWPNC